MNIHLWLVGKLKDRTVFEFFDECYRKIYQAPCRSNQIVIDVGHYRAANKIPAYVYRCQDLEESAKRTIPAHAVP